MKTDAPYDTKCPIVIDTCPTCTYNINRYKNKEPSEDPAGGNFQTHGSETGTEEASVQSFSVLHRNGNEFGFGNKEAKAWNLHR